MAAKQGRRKHIPQRTCVVCRRTFPKRELNRIIRSPEGEIRYDASGKAAGRGAYLCHDLTCWEKAISGPILARALKTQLTPAHRAALKAELTRRKTLQARTTDNG
jgi:predicted RNA-binding protein YlxR (DUF448 family)